jgi:hypothetical protein
MDNITKTRLFVLTIGLITGLALVVLGLVAVIPRLGSAGYIWTGWGALLTIGDIVLLIRLLSARSK